MTRRILAFSLGTWLLMGWPVVHAQAVELPTRKPGLWEMKIVRSGSPIPAPARISWYITTRVRVSGATSPNRTDRGISGAAAGPVEPAQVALQLLFLPQGLKHAFQD